jgi:hypothetical protein
MIPRAVDTDEREEKHEEPSRGGRSEANVCLDLVSDGRSTRIRPEKTPRQSKSTLKNSDPQGGLGFTRAFADLGLNVKALCRRHTLIFEPYADVGDDNYEGFTLNAG